MTPHRHDDVIRKGTDTGAAQPARATPRLAGGGSPARVRSVELLRDGAPLIIEHAGREYYLRVTSKGKLILTA